MQPRLIIPIAALILSYLVLFAWIAFSYDDLPVKVASHFDIFGQPNGWMSRNSCVAFTLGLGILVPALVIGMMGGAGRIPVSFINLPHRDYWMSPERRQAAVAILLRYSLWFSCLNVLFVTGLHTLIVLANWKGAAPHLSGLGITLIAGGFLIGTGFWTSSLLKHFSKIT